MSTDAGPASEAVDVGGRTEPGFEPVVDAFAHEWASGLVHAVYDCLG